MATVITNPQQTAVNRLAISEQNKILKYVIQKVKDSNIFGNLEINFNDLRTDVSNVGIILNSGSRKSRVYVDGGYDAEIPITVILRCIGEASDDRRLHNIDLVNQLGIWFDENIQRDKSVTGYTIYSVNQTNQANITYADESGIEDVGANFTIMYSKD